MSKYFLTSQLTRVNKNTIFTKTFDREVLPQQSGGAVAPAAVHKAICFGPQYSP
jgi:hypothetical protein